MESQYKNQSQYIPQALGVTEYAYHEEVNLAYREGMQDGYFICDDVLKDAKSILFGVMDGHGGKQVAEYVIANFAKNFQAEIQKNPQNAEEALKQTFHLTDEEMKKQVDSQEMGATATIGFIRYEESKRMLYIANVGDSKASLFDQSTFTVMTYEHKAEDDKQRARVKQAGGSVMFGRVAGVLAVSRAFGDHSLRKFGVIATPDIKQVELRKIHKFIVVATDGMWDVITEEEVMDVLKAKSNSSEISQILVQKAIDKDTQDNTSVLVIKL